MRIGFVGEIRLMDGRRGAPEVGRRGGCPRAAIAAAGAVALTLSTATDARETSPVAVIPPEDRPRLAAEIRGAIARYDSASAFPLPHLDDERLGDLFEGEVVRFREKWVLSQEGQEDERTRQRALAFRLVPSPRLQVWISATDPHFVLNDRVREFRLAENEAGDATWYQFMDLPWPVRNRHWVIRLRSGVEVTAATAGAAWERSWRLVPGGEAVARQLAASGRTEPLRLDDVRGARYLEANDGAWALFELGEDLTLVTYNLTIVMGGWIPEGMAARFAMRALEDLLDRVAANAERVPGHYVEGHEPLRDGNGRVIPFWATSERDEP